MTTELADRLSEAAGSGDVEALDRLLAAGADLNARDSSGRTAIISAAAYDQIATVKRLLELGADVSVTDEMGFTPVDVATMNDHHELASLLREHGAHGSGSDLARRVREKLHAGAVNVSTIYPNVRSDEELLVVAASQGDIDTVRSVLERGVDVDARIETGFTALIATAATEHSDVMRLLLESGADPNLAEEHGVTPLAAAQTVNNKVAAALLLAHGASITDLVRPKGEPGIPGTRSEAKQAVRRPPPPSTRRLPDKRPVAGSSGIAIALWVVGGIVVIALTFYLFHEPGPEPIELSREVAATPAPAEYFQAGSDSEGESVAIVDKPASIESPNAVATHGARFEELWLYAGSVARIEQRSIEVGGNSFVLTPDTRYFLLGTANITIPDAVVTSAAPGDVKPLFYGDPRPAGREMLTVGQIVTVYAAHGDSAALAIRAGAIPGAVGLEPGELSPLIIEVQGTSTPLVRDPIVSEIVSN